MKILILIAIATACYAGTGCDIPEKWNFGFLPFYENRYKQDSSYNDQGFIVPLLYNEKDQVIKFGDDSLIYDDDKITIINSDDNLIREYYSNINGNDSILIYSGPSLVYKVLFKTTDSIASLIEYHYGELLRIDSIIKQQDGSVINKNQYYWGNEWQFYTETCRPFNDSCNCELDTITTAYPLRYIDEPLYVYENGHLKYYKNRDIYYSSDYQTKDFMNRINSQTKVKVGNFYKLNGKIIKSMPNKR